MRLSIVVPIYNERENIRRLYEALQCVLPRMGETYEVILVNDGSRDGSKEELDRLARLDPAVKVVHFRRNFGQTAAMSAGIDMASGEIIVLMDGDLQNDPGDIPMMVAKLGEGYDLVHGWRKIARTRSSIASCRQNRQPSDCAFTRFPVHDLGCTLKVIRSEIAKDLRMYGEMHRFIPILAHWQGGARRGGHAASRATVWSDEIWHRPYVSRAARFADGEVHDSVLRQPDEIIWRTGSACGLASG